MATKPPIVADSSPLISAARAHRLCLVRKVYRTLILPEAVYNEIVIQGRSKPGASEIKKAKNEWIQVMTVQNRQAVQNLQVKFGIGESEAIVLAEELKTTLLADEAAVILEARRRGIPLTSTIMMLFEAKTKGFTPSIKKELDKFIKAGFRIDEELYQNALRQAGECEL